jgi:hypothetical protein
MPKEEEILVVTIPTEVLKNADKLMETTIKTAMTLAGAMTFEFNCGKCDEVHTEPLSDVIIMSLLRANVEYMVRKVFDDMPQTIINDLSVIFQQLYENNTANAQLLHDVMMERVQEFHKKHPDPGVPEEAVAGIMTIEIGEWNSGTAH